MPPCFRMLAALYAALTIALLALAGLAPLLSESAPQRLTSYLIFGLLALSVAMVTGFGLRRQPSR